MIEGYTPVAIEHFGGLVASWPAEMLDASLLVEATNLRFTQAEVSSREGLARAFATPNVAPVAGLVDYVHLDGTEQPVVFDATGKLYVESPAGSGAIAAASPGTPTVMPAGSWMNGVPAFSRVYMAFGDNKKGLGQPLTYDGANIDPVAIAGPATAPTAADSGAAGNIAAGQRFLLVLFQTREGSLSTANSGLSITNWTAAGSKKVTVSNIPVSSSTQVVARIIAFTVAGGSNAGPYYYIPFPALVNGVSETSTIVGDNSTTSATFNFDDSFLASSIDVTDQFRAITLPDEAGVAFSEATQRLMWWGDPANPSVVQCSQPSDGGNYFGDTGFFEVEADDGQRMTAVFEFRNQIYAAKEYGLFLVTPNNGDPATWDINQVVPGVGVCGPRAVAVGGGLVVFVHRTGVFTFDGGVPALVSDELLGPSRDRPGVWERINWAYDYLIWVAIDHEEKCVRIGVPLDGSTTCSHILKVSYLDGWEPCIRFSPFTARYHFFPGRRWSLDTIAATQAVRIRRTLASPGPGFIPADQRTAQSQMLLGSSAANGRVYYLNPSATDDDGVPFFWAMRTGAVSAAEILKQNRQGMELVGMVQVRARGRGRVSVEAAVNDGDPQRFMEMDLADRPEGDYAGLALVQGEAVGLRLAALDADDGGSALRLRALYAFAKPVWTLRPAAAVKG